jgi:hypothetical protein
MKAAKLLMQKRMWLVSLWLMLCFLVACGQVTQTSTNNRSFRFVVMGDSRGTSTGSAINTAILSSVVTRIASLEPTPEFIIFAGDLVYSGGETQLQLWKNITAPLTLEGIEIYPSIGNHEMNVGYETGQAAFQAAFDLPQNGPPGYEELAYYFDYADARFICLDSFYWDGETYFSNEITDAQLTWLLVNLWNNTQTHTFVFAHSPAYPVDGHVGDSLDQDTTKRDSFWASLDSNQVDAYFCGHEHCYSRYNIDSGINPDYVNTVYQLICGSVGAPLSSANSSVSPEVFVSDYNFMVVDVNGSQVDYTVYNDHGVTLDSFSAVK